MLRSGGGDEKWRKLRFREDLLMSDSQRYSETFCLAKSELDIHVFLAFLKRYFSFVVSCFRNNEEVIRI